MKHTEKTPLETLRHHVSGAIERGAAQAIAGIPSPVKGVARIRFEYTDTFGGEANYSWVKRLDVDLPADISDIALMRKAKAWAGLSGVRGKSASYGDCMEFRPFGCCTVLFIFSV